MYATTIAALPTFCPQCETELDQASGICPACRWDSNAVEPEAEIHPAEDPRSFSERYRDTRFDQQVGVAATYGTTTVTVNRTRLVLGVSFLGVIGLFYVVANSLSVF